MTLLDDLVNKYSQTDLGLVFTKVGIDGNKISEINRQVLKEVTLAQWLLESGRASSDLATKANNFAGLKWREPDMIGFAEPLKIKVPSETEEVTFCKFADVDAFIVGYWKFLTRSPYKGLEEHTNTPENFLGFLKSKGYSSAPDYIPKIVNLLPEAQKLLTNVSGVEILPSPVSVEQLQVIRAPQELTVGQVFNIEGVARLTDKGRVMSVMIDDRFPVEGVKIGEDGKWQLNFVFNQAGDRTMLLGIDDQSLTLKFKVILPVAQQNQSTSTTPEATVIQLTGSVGVGGVNKPDDVKAVKARLYELGYTWAGEPNTPSINRGLYDAIRLFQSIIAGRSTVQGDGRVDVDGTTHQWLQAANAPRWVLMPESEPDNGFINGELAQTHDHHDFGTHWLAETIKNIAQDYQNSYRNTRPNAAPFAINDVSLPHGGDTPDHRGHETGMMCDVFLPRKNGQFGGISWTNAEYDRDATRAILKSIRQQKLVRLGAVFFNDSTLIREGLCKPLGGHDHHIHFEINPPARS
ncbi:glucosaminidase domain-containing protein [Anabaena sp. CA = ATCC 33047]|uniref:glucosaminidase domain-containing protein n=1 Tax=Anabaena sp. (strain CA / ATCC 33047) TaxID=52271 RepID=UPI00082F4E84|nr:glucosaminidase domain-containing protein [Anabaena sp. CA = ATCC 33047]